MCGLWFVVAVVKKDFLSILDVGDNLEALLDETKTLKKRWRSQESDGPLRFKTLAMIFEKPSTRTRISFEAGMAQLGGTAINLTPQDLQLGRGETLEDTARALSRYVDSILYRAFHHEDVLRLARSASVPVINGLDDLEHPCQILSDLFTIREAKGKLAGLKLAYIGDGNNVCNSLLLGCALSEVNITVACPKGYEPDQGIHQRAREIASRGDSSVVLTQDPKSAARDADIIYTDTWVSMGMEEERERRERDFGGFQVSTDLLGVADDEAIVMHCLPAHRGQEISDEVMDGPRSIVWEQAENRLHAQKAVLLWLMGGIA